MWRHDYEKEAVLRQRMRSDPAHPGAYTKVGAWLARAGRMAQAREALQTGLAAARPASRVHHLLGLLFASAGDYEAGLRHLERAATQEPARLEFLRDLALAQGAAGRTVSSLESLRQVVAMGGDGPSGLEWLLRIGERAVAESGARAERRPPQSPRRAVMIERVVSREPEVAEALIPRKGSPGSGERETLRAARRALARLAARNPSYPDLYFGLGLVAEELGETDHAIQAAEHALALNPRYVEACLLAVRLYEKRGDPVRAAARCRQATVLRPKWIDAHLRLGRLLRDQGLRGEAAEAYRGALGIDGNCQEARDEVKALEAALVAEGGAP